MSKADKAGSYSLTEGETQNRCIGELPWSIPFPCYNEGCAQDPNRPKRSPRNSFRLQYRIVWIRYMPWVYEPDRDRKHKRNWRHNYAGFVEVANSVVAKCPHGMTPQECEHLLNTDSIEYRPRRWPHDYPERIYNIRDKVVYRATPTNPGQSYHGFPELQDRIRELPRNVKDQILARADQLGCRQEVEKWLKG